MCIGFGPNQRRRLHIKAFYIHLSSSALPKSLPDSLTLCYLPRISGSPLDVGDSSVRPDSPAFVTLHRIVSARKVTRGAVYGSRERVRASEGVRFEVYLRDDKLLKAIFRRDDSGNWKIEGKCALENGGSDVEEVGVCTAVEGAEEEVVSERVEMTVRRRRRRNYPGLEEIPEERGEAEGEGECCWCCDCCGDEDGETEGGDGQVAEMEMEMEGVRWAVDLGIWVMCLGVGYLVSRASSKSIRRPRLL